MEIKEVKNNYIYGMHSVKEAILSGKKIEKVLFKQGLEGQQFREVMELVQEQGIPSQFVPGQKLDYITKGRHQGIIALMSQLDYMDFDEMVELAFNRSEKPIFLLLDGVSDVRNLGAIARTAECAGVSGIVVPAKGGAAINSDAIKTSAGALLRMNTSRVQNLRMAIYLLKEYGAKIVAATEKSEDVLYNVDLTTPIAIVMGSEGKGISESVLALCDEKVSIPMGGQIGSLNVSIASSIILFEAVRQRL